MEGPVTRPSDVLIQAVAKLSEESGRTFKISDEPVPNTQLFVVHTENHEFRPEYTVVSGTLGFRVPFNFPDAAPEDSFFIIPADLKLHVADSVRQSTDLNRVGRTDNFVVGSELANVQVLVFSWHLWDRTPWDRRRNTLMDHYTHCVRRFERPEHD
jgi:hypothetical protein